MARVKPAITAANAGEFGDEMIARIDFDRYQMAASSMRNFLPKATGGFERRMGWRDVMSLDGTVRLINFKSTRQLDYLVLARDTGGGQFQFIYNDGLVVATSGVTITNGTFAVGLTGWTDSSTGGASVAGGSGLTLTTPVNSSGSARLDQNITGVTVDTEYEMELDVSKGPVVVKLGSAQGSSSYSQTVLETGTHVLSVVPEATDFWIRIESDAKVPAIVTSITSPPANSGGIPHSVSAANIPNIRTTQVGDVLFMANGADDLHSISRYGTNAFGYGLEQLRQGPYEDVNLGPITITPSGVDGAITLTASDNLFEPGSVDQLIRLTHAGATETVSATTDNTFTNEIEISGSGTFRRFLVTISGIAGDTVTLQRSFGTPGNYIDFKDYTADITEGTVDDNLDGSTVFYRLGVKTGNLPGGGPVTMTISTDGGTSIGDVKVVGYTSPTEVDVEVQERLGQTGATGTWQRSHFSGNRKPIEVEFQEGRLWLASASRVFGSQSDDFTNFLIGTDDSDAIERTTTSRVQWLRALGELGVGVNDGVTVARSGAHDGAIYTPANFRLKLDNNDGADNQEAIAINNVGIYVRKDRETLAELAYDSIEEAITSTSLIRLNPRITQGGIKRIVFQKTPERRIWVLKETGEVVILTYLRDENVIGWARMDFDGIVNDISISVGERFDRVYADMTNAAGVRRLCIYADETWTEPAQANHLDFSTSVTPDQPTARITISGATNGETGYTGTITVTASAAVFDVSMVGGRFYTHQGMGTVASFVSATEITVTITTPLKSVTPVAAGFWWIGLTTTSITNPALANRTDIYGWADGQDIGPLTANGAGQMTLPEAVGWVHVGLRNRAVFKSMMLFQGAQASGGIAGITKRPNEMGLTLLRSGNRVRVGFIDEDTVDTITHENFETGSIFTGDVVQRLDGQHELDPRCYIVADQAAPCTVLAYSPMYMLNER